MIVHGRTALAALAATAALLLAAAPAGAGPAANASGEELISYVTTGKLKVAKTIRYFAVCGAPAGEQCGVTATSKIKLKGPDLGPISSSGTFFGGQGIEVFLKPNRSARKSIIANLSKSRLVSELTATNLTTGEVDTDYQAFRFKR